MPSAGFLIGVTFAVHNTPARVNATLCDKQWPTPTEQSWTCQLPMCFRSASAA